MISPFFQLEDEVVSETEDTVVVPTAVVPGTKTDKDISTRAGVEIGQF